MNMTTTESDRVCDLAIKPTMTALVNFALNNIILKYINVSAFKTVKRRDTTEESHQSSDKIFLRTGYIHSTG